MSKQKAAILEKLSKEKYNAVYLGWKECKCLYGLEITTPVIQDMIYGQRPDSFKFEDLPRVVIGVSRKELKVTQTVTKKPGKTEAVKFHIVPTKDLMFASRGSSPDDCVIACVYLGFNPTTKAWAHVHAYLCDNSLTAETLLRHLYQYLNTPYHRDRLIRLEREMVKKGQIQARVPPDDGTPYDEMGFPKITDVATSVGGSTADYSIYGVETNEKQPDDNPSSPYQQYLVANGGGALNLPRPVSSSSAESSSSKSSEHIRLGYTRSSDSANSDNRVFLGNNDDYSSKPRSYSPFPGAITGYTTGMQQEIPGAFNTQQTSSNVYQADLSRMNISGVARPIDDVCPPDYDNDVSLPTQTPLAAELKAKFGRGPLLLPPKDYDTVNRTRGNLMGIEARKCRNEDIVGKGERKADSRAGQFEWSGR